MDLEKRIGYHFREKQYLQTAVTHSSYANEMKDPTPYNERQEFLGDAVLSIVVSDYLFKNSSLAEGDLTKLRAALVCEKSCLLYTSSRTRRPLMPSWPPSKGWSSRWAR